MSILFINGSPNHHGNTASLAAALLKGKEYETLNLTDYTKTSIYSAFEMLAMEARRYGVNVVGSEVIGLVPQKALIDCAEYYLQIENFSMDQILENRIAE